jgi:predicted RNA binding protein YcfA (HicA-like mRNA interferase family)
MTKLVPISGRKLCRILEKLGFIKVHQVGSHIRYKHTDGRRTVIPVHSNEKISIGLLKDILKQIKLSREEYERLRRKI